MKEKEKVKNKRKRKQKLMFLKTCPPLISEFVVFVKLRTELQMINLDVVQNYSNRFDNEIQRGQVFKKTALMFSSAK